jgi:hypothetical protein
MRKIDRPCAEALIQHDKHYAANVWNTHFAQSPFNEMIEATKGNFIVYYSIASNTGMEVAFCQYELASTRFYESNYVEWKLSSIKQINKNRFQKLKASTMHLKDVFVHKVCDADLDVWQGLLVFESGTLVSSISIQGGVLSNIFSREQNANQFNAVKNMLSIKIR